MEEQQAEQNPESQQGTTEAQQNAAENAEQLAREKAVQARQVQGLMLTRARICEQLARSSNERYSAMLQSELAQIDGELAKLN